jgi:phosphatidylserine/phosphatidylglycerophosphate/cardiolipin synthase-like enzyme
VLSTPNSFKRYEGEGIIELLTRKSDEGVKVRLLLNQNDDIQQSIERLVEAHPRITIRGLTKLLKPNLQQLWQIENYL